MDSTHPQITALLADLEALPGGPRLPADALERWALELRADPARSTLGDQLIALSLRFTREGGQIAAQQLLGLAMLLVDEKSWRAGLAAGDLPAGEAKKLIDAAKGGASALGKGLPPPGDAKRKRR